jgi:hypothetical protein
MIDRCRENAIHRPCRCSLPNLHLHLHLFNRPFLLSPRRKPHPACEQRHHCSPTTYRRPLPPLYSYSCSLYVHIQAQATRTPFTSFLLPVVLCAPHLLLLSLIHIPVTASSLPDHAPSRNPRYPLNKPSPVERGAIVSLYLDRKIRNLHIRGFILFVSYLFWRDIKSGHLSRVHLPSTPFHRGTLTHN